MHIKEEMKANRMKEGINLKYDFLKEMQARFIK